MIWESLCLPHLLIENISTPAYQATGFKAANNIQNKHKLILDKI